MTTSSEARRRFSLNLLGILSVSTTSRRIHAFGGLGADPTILIVSPELRPATDQKFRESFPSNEDRFFCRPTQQSSLSQFAFLPAGAETGRSSWKYSNTCPSASITGGQSAIFLPPLIAGLILWGRSYHHAGTCQPFLSGVSRGSQQGQT
jgi:hypothetical protein